MSSDTKTRVTVLETILGIFVEREQLSVCDKLDAIFVENSMIRNEPFEQRDVVLIRVEKLAVAWDAQNSAARKTTNRLEIEIALLKMAVSGLLSGGEVATKVKVLKPNPFNGARSFKDLENFL